MKINRGRKRMRNKNKFKPSIYLAGLLAVCVLLGAANRIMAEANYVAAFLQNGVGGRTTGMGDNYTAVATGSFGQLYNPAGLALAETPALGFQFDGTGGVISHNVLSGIMPLGPGALGALFNFYSYGDFTELDSSGQPTGKTLKPSDVLIDVGYGMSLGPKWRTGLNAGIFVEKLGEIEYSGVVIDLGGSFDPAPDWSLSAVLKNLGAKVDGYTLPSSLRMAGAFWTIQRRLLIDAELEMVFGSIAEFGMGAEYRAWDWLDIRTGFKVPLSGDQASSVEGIVLGLGFNLAQFGIDLTFMNRGDFGNEFGVAVEYYFNQPRVKPIAKATPKPTPTPYPKYVYKPEPKDRRMQGENREQAEYHYKAGQEYEKYGQTIDAIIEYKAALKLLPAFTRAQKALAKAKQKARSQVLEKEQMKTVKPAKKNASLQQLIRKYYNKGEKAYNIKDYTQAIKQLQLVLELTTQHRKATELLGKAKKALKTEMAALSAQASRASEKGDIVAEVDAYQKMLDLDPANKIAKGKLAAAKQRIPEEVDRLYKQGLNHYARQELRKALHAFESLLKLQPDHVKARDAVNNIKEKLVQTGQ